MQKPFLICCVTYNMHSDTFLAHHYSNQETARILEEHTEDGRLRSKSLQRRKENLR